LAENESLFELFDFVDIHRIGQTLVGNIQKRLKRALRDSGLSDHKGESFLGRILGDFYDQIMEDVPKVLKEDGAAAKEVRTLQDFKQVEDFAETFIGLCPFVGKLFVTLHTLKTSGRLQDDFYLNYTVEEIDFEAIIISSFANFAIGNKADDKGEKLGISIDELRRFTALVLDEEARLKSDDKTNALVTSFLDSYGLAKVTGMPELLMKMVRDQLEGYEYESLRFEDFKHVGGPILLSKLPQ
jgi:hypothetical protein